MTSVLCTVHGSFKKAGYETIIVNNNPETVSTDFDIADKLYFEPLTPEDVQNIVDFEKPDGAVVQFGGQTAIKLTESLMKMGVPILRYKGRRCRCSGRQRTYLTKSWRRAVFQEPAGDTVLYRRGSIKAAANCIRLSGTCASFLCTWRTGHADCRINDEEIVEFMDIINQNRTGSPDLD